MAISIDEIKYTPDPIKAGGKVKGTCKVTADGDIESVKVYDPDYNVFQAYDDGTHGDDVAGDGSIQWKRPFPTTPRPERTM